MIWSVLFYIWLAGYVVILLAIAKTYQEGYLSIQDVITFAATGIWWPPILLVYGIVRCL